MIVTREVINKRIKFTDFPDDTSYYYEDLSRLVDAYKNLLLYKYSAKAGQSALLGAQAGITQLALVFACLELGLSIVIVDYGRADDFENEYYDPKTIILLPIDFFIIPQPNESNKFRFFQGVCDTTINLEEEILDYSPNTVINCTPDTLILKCTSSGTTGTPKRVEHTHQFIAELIKRNSTMFDGVVGQAFNLSHGSSLATFFLPTLVSTDVTEYINFSVVVAEEVLQRHDPKHLMLPYPNMIELFGKAYMFSNRFGITLYTLSYIDDKWEKFTAAQKVKDIISFFGSNETSGPTLINNRHRPDFDKQAYRRFDDFYNFEIRNGELIVKMPLYNSEIETKDKFEVVGDTFFHLGRDDLFRINGSFFNSNVYQAYASSVLPKSQMTFDFVSNQIYLAIWEDVENIEESVTNINNWLKEKSNGDHYISKYKVLDYNSFLSGVKLDQELLREYFRRNV